ncbi:MAG: hypothetical protein D6762_03355 [Candidatus Neomarinimicrobiota bacterium]|nr:MAG: hypothetical protein D6762_03355 [Candidatus Neomarinimicrobiota bacterium]
MAESSGTQKILLIALLLSGGYLGYDMFFHKTPTTKELMAQIQKKEAAVPAAAPQAASATPVLKPRQITSGQIKKVPSYAAVWGRDPFVGPFNQPPEVQEETAVVEEEPVYIEDYTLSAISFRGNQPAVIINQSILKPGDTINGLTLKQVNPSSVILVSPGGKEYTLNLKTVVGD